MSTTRAREAMPVDQVPRTAKTEPQPWRNAEDAEGWQPVRREKRGPGHWPLVGVEVDFDHKRSDWLRSEARRTGLDYVALVRKLVDDARARGAAD